MTAAEFEMLDEADATELLCTRFRRLTDVGYDPTHALVLAVFPQVELERAEELLVAGCSESAARLLIRHAA